MDKENMNPQDLGGIFQEESSPSPPEESKRTNRALKEWLQNLSPEQREQFCDALFRLLSSDNAATLTDLMSFKNRWILRGMRLDPQVCDYAQTRAEEITENFSHTRPNGQNYWTALGEAGIPYYPGGENISAGRESAAATMEGWMNSTGHRANILREGIGGVGIGYVQSSSGYGHYWVQIFVP